MQQQYPKSEVTTRTCACAHTHTLTPPPLHTHSRTHTHTHTYTTHSRTHTHTYTNTHTYIHTHAHTLTHTHTHTHARTHARTHAHTHARTHTHTHTSSNIPTLFTLWKRTACVLENRTLNVWKRTWEFNPPLFFGSQSTVCALVAEVMTLMYVAGQYWFHSDSLDLFYRNISDG